MAFTTINRVFNSIYFGAVARTVLSKELNTFSGHPICMALCWFCICEGILSYRKSSLDPSRKRGRSYLIENHMSFMFSAFVLALMGTTMVYVAKEKGDRPHFTTIHGFMGGIVASSLIFNSVSSSFVYNFKLGTKLSWTIHKLFGILLVWSAAGVSYLHVAHPDGYTLKDATDLTGDIGRYSFIFSIATLLGFIITGKK